MAAVPIRVAEGAYNRLASLAHLASWRDSVFVPVPTNFAEAPGFPGSTTDTLLSGIWLTAIRTTGGRAYAARGEWPRGGPIRLSAGMPNALFRARIMGSVSERVPASTS